MINNLQTFDLLLPFLIFFGPVYYKSELEEENLLMDIIAP